MVCTGWASSDDDMEGCADFGWPCSLLRDPLKQLWHKYLGMPERGTDGGQKNLKEGKILF